MRRLAVVFALITAFAFVAAPATAEDGPSDAPTQAEATDAPEAGDGDQTESPDEPDTEDGEKEAETPETETPGDPGESPAPEVGDDKSGEPTDAPSEDSDSTDDTQPEEGDEKSEDDGDSSDGTKDETPAVQGDVTGTPTSVTICHKDDAGYTEESVTADGSADGHDDHADDIIPSFDYDGGSYGGKNFDDAGKALLESGCKPAEVPLTPSDLTDQRLQRALVVVAAAQKIAICHATSAANNPYVSQSPNATADVNGHGGHTGPVFQTGFTNADDWGDIIPPFNLNGVAFPGLNWNAAGQAIFNAGCVVANNPPPPPPAGQVAICHATGDPQDPFDVLNVVADITVAGHALHADDIIPPFNINMVVFPGLNWDATGQAIFNAGCVAGSAVDPSERTPICHAVGDGFVRLSVPANATAGGHTAHLGDIIPPFTFGTNGSFAGLNFDAEGQEIFDNGCAVAAGGSDDNDDNDDSDDSDDSDDGDDDDAGGLPDAGGASLWALLMGCALVIGGLALVNNRQLAGAGGSLVLAPTSPTPAVPSWNQLVARPLSDERSGIDTSSTEKQPNRMTWRRTIASSIALAVVAFLIRNIVK